MQLVLLVGDLVVIDTQDQTRAELEEEYGDVVEVVPCGAVGVVELLAFPTDRVLRDEMGG